MKVVMKTLFGFRVLDLNVDVPGQSRSAQTATVRADHIPLLPWDLLLLRHDCTE